MPRFAVFAALVLIPAVFSAPAENKNQGRSDSDDLLPSLVRVGTSTGVDHDATSSAGSGGRYPGFPIPGGPNIPGILGYPYPGIGTGANVNMPGVNAGSIGGLGYLSNPGFGIPGVPSIPGIPAGFPGVGSGSSVDLQRHFRPRN